MLIHAVTFEDFGSSNINWRKFERYRPLNKLCHLKGIFEINGRSFISFIWQFWFEGCNPK